MHLRIGLACMAAFAFSSVSTRASAQTHDVNPGDDLFGVIADLAAGEEVVVHGGEYVTPGFREQHWNGAEGSPVVVRAAPGTTPVISGPADGSQNTLNISGQHFVFSGFEITSGSHGIRLGNVHDSTLEDLHIHDTGGVALSANFGGNEYYANTFRRLHIHHTNGTGEAMYLGCNDAACSFHDNVIEGCYIHHTNVGTDQGDGIEIKHGSYGNVVRNNVIHDAQYPCIIVYGAAGGAPNVIENNALWNCQDAGIQAAADAIIRNNLIFDVNGGISSHTHQGATPSNLTIVNNTLIGCASDCLHGSNWAGSTGIVVANNAFYAEGGTAVTIAGGGESISFHHNVVVGAVSGIDTGYAAGRGPAADFAGAAGHDAWPADDSPLIGAADPATAAAQDYNWLDRDDLPDVGAYEWRAGGNPCPAVADDFRAECGAAPDGDADSDSDSDADSDGDGDGDGDSDADGDGDTDADSDSDANADAGDDGGDDGCGCRAPGAAPMLPSLGLVTALAGWLALVRRRGGR